MRIVITDRVSTGGNPIASIRLFPLYLSNRLTFALIFRTYVGHYNGSQGTETEGHRSRSKVNAVGVTSILDRGQFSSFKSALLVIKLACRPILEDQTRTG